MSKAEAGADALGGADALSNVAGLSVSSMPGDVARKPPKAFARTSVFLSNALLRPRPRPPPRPASSDWGRPVGGSEGLGNLYPSSMNYTERTQVMGSVTTLTKSSKNNLTGNAAEAEPEERQPYMTRCQSLAVIPQPSTDAPPDYRSMHRSESEGLLLLMQNRQSHPRTRSDEARSVPWDNDASTRQDQDAELRNTSSSGIMTRSSNCIGINSNNADQDAASVVPSSSSRRSSLPSLFTAKQSSSCPSSYPVTVNNNTPVTEQDVSNDALVQSATTAPLHPPHTSLDQQAARLSSASSYLVDEPVVRSIDIAPPPSPPASVQSSSSPRQVIHPYATSTVKAVIPPATNDHGYPSPASSTHSSSIPSDHRPSVAHDTPSRAAANPAGRVSFDLVSASLAGDMMGPSTPRRGSAGLQPVGTSPRLESTSPAGNSRFFSRMSLPGSSNSRRGSADKSPIVENNKLRSRFKSFGKISRGSDAQRPPSTILGLKDSMQRWASASTDRLASNSSDRRSSMAVARDQATQPRKSLHLPSRAPDADFDNLPLDPPRPSFSAGPRSSFNFLRRGSAPQPSSPLMTPERERRDSSSFFSSFGFNRNNKPAPQAEPARSPAPVFQNSFLNNSHTSESIVGGIGQSAGSSYPSHNLGADVDPLHMVPESSPSVAPVSLVPESAPMRSLGIDQEQIAEASQDDDEVVAALPPNQVIQSSTSQGGASTDSAATNRTTSRSNRALSQLPRLNSMRAVTRAGGGGSSSGGGGGSDGNGNGGGRDGQDGRTNVQEETSEEEQEPSEDEEEDGDETGQTSDYHGMDSDEETDEEADNTTSSVHSGPLAASTTSTPGGGLNRVRPAASLVMPPAPMFIPSVNEEAGQTHSSDEEAAAQGFKQVIGRNSWTSFNATGFTPFETPTPNVHGSTPLTANAHSMSGQTPRARQESSESSYFAARPGTASTAAAGSGSMSGTAPPPSPSIITRSRAPSSASMRPGRTPGAGSGPIPNRSMPAPAGTFMPLGLSRQMSGVSTTSRHDINRSKSPAASLKRPGTTGTLTPQRPGRDGDRTPSREASMERPASERGPKRELLPNDSGFVNGTSKQKAAVSPSGAATAGLGSRPAFYHQKSKSLIDLLGPSSRRAELSGSSTPIISTDPASANVSPGRAPSYTAAEASSPNKKDRLAPIATGSTTKAGLPSPGVMSLGRRRSMFEMRAEPPPYSIIHNRPEGPQMILPREEEGKEKLPTYYCGVHIEGYLPRKLEFSAPGVQAKDRSWKRQYFVLHGTSLRVYRNDLSVDRSASNGVWGEMKGVHVHMEPMNEDGTASTSLVSQAANKAISHTPLAHRGDGTKVKDSTAFDAKNGLIRNYTLQSAESGLAADYLKRRHVVRVRAEGEQFLLQTRSDRHVVDWIEALQASTNVAADLESRQMPKFITLPRRRRRRRRDADGSTLTAEQQEARDLAEAQRRSVAESGGASTTTSRRPSVAPDSTPLQSTGTRPSISAEDGLDPSAAFEEMLREDQEEIARHNAADI